MMKPLQASKSIDGAGNLILSRKCRVTDDPVSVTVTLAEYHRWQGGELIQEVWPKLTGEEREFIRMGFTQAEWESIFSDEEEEDDDKAELYEVLERLGETAPVEDIDKADEPPFDDEEDEEEE